MRACQALWAGVAIAVCAAGRTMAADGIWTNTVGGNWADPANWQDGVVAGGVGATAYFSDAPASHLIVTLPPEGVTLRKLSHRQQATTGNTLFRGGPFILDGETPEIFAPEGYYLNLASDLQGSNGLIWNGGGVLCTDTSYTGPTILNSGTLHDHMWYGVSTDSTSISNHLSTGPLVFNGGQLDVNGRPDRPASSSTWLLTEGDRVVRKVADALAAAAGASVTGEGIQAGTFVKQFIDATSFELNVPATASGERLLSFGAVAGSESHQRFDRIEVNKDSVLMVNLNGGSVARVQADDLTGGAYALTKTWDGTFALKGGSAFNGTLAMSGGALELLAQTNGLPTVVSNVTLNTRTRVAVPESAATASLPNLAAAGELVKSGAGNLVLKELSGPETRVTVEGGTLTLAAKTFPPSLGLIGDAWFHVDASDPASLTLSQEGSMKFVTRWNDVRTNGVFAAVEAGQARPYLDEGFQNGLPVVDFGMVSYFNVFGYWDYGAYLKWSEACSTIREGFLVYSDRTEDLGRFQVYGWPFLLGHTGAYQFHRQAGGILLHSDWAAGELKSGAWAVDGSAWNSVTTTPLPTGFHVVAFAATGPVAADNFARDREVNTRGGQRLAEVLIYTNTLTEAERQQVTAYLYNKWIRTKVGILTYTGDGTVEVGAGTDAHVGILDIGANVVKTGAGTLTADTIQQRGGSLTVQAGQLVLGPTAAPAAAPASFPWFHVDASDPASLTLVSENGTNFVTRWDDVRTNGVFAAAAPGDSRPYLREGFQNGRPVLDFGSPSYPAVGRPGYGAYLDWSTTCSALREGFLVFSDREEDLGLTGTAFLLGHPAAYQFHRGAGGALLEGTYAEGALRSGSWAIDGGAVNAVTTPLPGGFHVVSFAATGPVAAGTFGRDRDVNGRGGLRLAEVLVYDRVLSQRERRDTEDYLMRKWLGKGAPGYENGTSAMEGGVTFAGDAALTVGGETRSLTLDWLVAGGALVKDGAGAVSVGSLRSGVTGINVAAGRLTVACDLEQPWFHVDASDPASLTTVSENGTNFVTRWSDVRTNGVYAAAEAGEARPFLREGYQNGLPVVDFGMASYRFLGMPDYGGYLNWSTACSTIREGFLVYRDRTEDLDRLQTYGYAFLLGHHSAYQFHRGPAGALLNGEYADGALRGGAWAIDGSAWNSVTTEPLPAGFHVISFAATGPVAADNFARDRETNERGGQQLAEVLIYTNALTPDVRQRIQARLLAKWITGTRQLTQLRVASNSVAAMPESIFEVASLQGEGSVSAARITASAVSAGDAADEIGALSVAGTLELADGAVVDVDVVPPACDRVDVDGTLRILGGGTFAIRCEADGLAGFSPAVFTFAAIEGAENLSSWTLTGEVCSRYAVKPRVVGSELQLVFAARGMMMILR